MFKISQISFASFLGDSPSWYKTFVLSVLFFNPLFYLFLTQLSATASIAGMIVGWFFVFEFILFLGMSIFCYPLLPGGLLAIEAILMGLCSVDNVYHEIAFNLPVILLLIFVVASVSFLKDWLSFVFTAALIKISSKTHLSLAFLFFAAILSAFLDALTVTVVFILVLRQAYFTFKDVTVAVANNSETLERFRSFLRSLIMHAAVGTALGGVSTMVGEPQNLLIAKTMQDVLLKAAPNFISDWNFMGFMIHMAPFSVACLMMGALTTIVVEKFRLCGHGEPMPEVVRHYLLEAYDIHRRSRSPQDKYHLFIQTLGVLFLVFGLAFHIAEVGLIGLALIIFLTSFMGVKEEHKIADAFKDALPFTALLVIFFSIIAIIHDQNLFAPVVHFVFSFKEKGQLFAMFTATGLLSAISDNVFVATVFIKEVIKAFNAGLISVEQLEKMAIVVNAGTNLPSIATPNGQAAFLLLLTSSFSTLIGLSYLRMLLLALPYTVVLVLTCFGVLLYF